jgi:hypothetical protein
MCYSQTSKSENGRYFYPHHMVKIAFYRLRRVSILFDAKNSVGVIEKYMYSITEVNQSKILRRLSKTMIPIREVDNHCYPRRVVSILTLLKHRIAYNQHKRSHNNSGN